MNKLFEKIIAVVLVLILAGANLVMLGSYTAVYALTDSQLAGQTTTTQNANVEFNAYFEGGGHTKSEKTDTKGKLYLNIKVKNAGYLKNGVVTFKDTNFKIDSTFKNDLVQSFDIEKEQIILKQLNNGSNITIEVPIVILSEERVKVDNFSKEVTATFTGTYVDSEGKERAISKSIVNKLSWNGTAEANVKSELTKYIPYVVDEKYGVMVQAKVNTNIVESKLPIQTTEVAINAPEINGVKPTSVTVIANNTKATNGQANGVNFVKDNYTYDATTGEVKITVKNEADDNKQIAWAKNAADEELVTFIYEGQDIYNYVKENGLNTSMTTNAKIQLYNDVETSVEKSVTTELKSEEKLGTLTDFNMALTEQIGKGQIYANYVAKNKMETEYSTTYSATISNTALVNEVTFTQDVDSFMTKENGKALTTVSGNNYAYNKTVKISEAVFNKMLGEEGALEVLTIDGKQIGIINKETIENEEIKSVKEEDGNYVLDITEANNNRLVIKTTKPITEGEIVVSINKAIKENIDYSQAQMQTFIKLEAGLTGNAGTTKVTASKQMAMQEVKSVAAVEVSKTDLTTVVKNENVEIRGILDTSSIYNALYKNPTLKFKLPSYINKVEIKDAKILMDENLKIKGTPQITTENGALVINVTLEGTQQDYTINADYKGAIVRITADLTVKTLTPSNKNKITMTFTNENEVSTNKTGTVETELNFVAPTGIVTANAMSNYAEGKPSIMSISDDSKEVEIATYSDKRTVTISGTVVNNYSNKIGNVVVLGRFPAQDNTKIDTDASLGSTFNATLKNTINVTGIDSAKYTVYYSEKGDATTDLANKENGWSTTATTGAKSYMIVTKNYEMAAGETIKFSYDTELPENLAHNNEVYQMYKVYYNNISSIGRMAETKASPIMALSTGQGPELAAEVTSNTETVREGQILKMQATVKNTGEVTAENVKVNVEATKYTTLVEPSTSGFFAAKSSEINVGTIEKGKSKTISYYLKMDDDTVGIPHDGDGEEVEEDEGIDSQKFPKEVIHKVSVTADDLDGKITSSEYKMQLQDGKIALQLYSDVLESQTLIKGTKVEFVLGISNIEPSNTLDNAVINIQIPKGIECEDISVGFGQSDETAKVNYNTQTNTLQVTIPKIESSKVLRFNGIVQNIEEKFSMVATAKADGIEEHISNTVNYSVAKVNLEVSELTSTPKYVKEKENITYNLKITNKGEVEATSILITDKLAEELEFIKATYTYGQEEKTITALDGEEISIDINHLNAGETTNVTIIARAKLLKDQKDKEVKNQVSISANALEKIQTNTVTNIIEYYAGAHTGEGQGGSSTNGRYKITGTAWADSNKDGKRAPDETLLGGITVLLLNKSDNSIVKDVDSNEPKQVTTDSNGKYEFTNLPKGEYLVVFLYDAGSYSLTTYQAQGVDTNLNSDAIDINITYEGERRVAGITDVLSITDSNIRDIDIGLYSAEKFDLRLDKYVSKINLTTPTIGTRTDEYNNAKTGKVEILGRNAGKSNIAIEYKIVVKNEGAVPGYVKKIVDYLPKDASFSTELNKDWYLSDNGNAYNASLANEKINPGESKEVTIVLTKKISESSIGSIINNNAEIYEAYNELGLKDIDSTPGNKVETEDDMSEANVVLSLVTGKIILYTTLAIAIIAVVGFSCYVIKKRVLDTKEN